MSPHTVAGWLTAFLLLAGTTTLHAQGIFEGLFDKAKHSTEQKARDRVNQGIDQSIDKGMNKTQETMQCVATDQECLKRAKDQGKAVSVVNGAFGFRQMRGDRYRLPQGSQGPRQEG